MKVLRFLFRSFFLTAHIGVVALFLRLRLPRLLLPERSVHVLLAFHPRMAVYLDWITGIRIVLGASEALFPGTCTGRRNSPRENHQAPYLQYHVVRLQRTYGRASQSGDRIHRPIGCRHRLPTGICRRYPCQLLNQT